ncbi:MAG TPA: hypothetical protein VG892_00670 [Terriglobales bacterium]|nr:hypothetical protein [Terriglobales bacterium]
MSPVDICQWIQNTSLSTSIRESVWLFPIIETTHVLGLAVSVGTVVWFDLRLLGVGMKHQPVGEVFRQIMRFCVWGFMLMFITGGLLFWSAPVELYLSVYFRIKIALLVLAGLNAAVFQFHTLPKVDTWDPMAKSPTGARVIAGISLALWTGVVLFGRATAYNVFH